MVLRRGAYRVHVQFGLQKLLTKAKRSLRLRRLDNSGDDVRAPTVGVVEDGPGSPTNLALAGGSRRAPHHGSQPAGRALGSARASKAPVPRRGAGNGRVKLSAREKQKLVEQERKRVLEAQRRRKRRQRQQQQEAASMYMPCCRPEKNADGTSSTVGMSIFSQYPDRCNICGKQLRRKIKTPAMLRKEQEQQRRQQTRGSDDGASSESEQEEASSPEVQERAKLPLSVIVSGPSKPTMKIRATKGGRMVTPEGGVPGFLRGTHAWDELTGREGPDSNHNRPPNNNSNDGSEDYEADRNGSRLPRDPSKFFRAQSPAAASRDLARDRRQGAFLPAIDKKQKQQARRAAGNTARAATSPGAGPAARRDGGRGQSSQLPALGPSSHPRGGRGGKRGLGASLLFGGPAVSLDPKLARRERGWRDDSGVATMARTRGLPAKKKHGEIVARVEGYNLIPNFGEKEERSLRASRRARSQQEAAAREAEKARRAQLRQRAVELRSYTDSHRGLVPAESIDEIAASTAKGGARRSTHRHGAASVGENDQSSVGNSTQASTFSGRPQRLQDDNSSLSPVSPTERERRILEREMRISSKVGQLQQAAIEASPKSTHALEGARALLAKGLITQTDFDAIRREVLSIVAAEAHAKAKTYGGTVRLGATNVGGRGLSKPKKQATGRHKPRRHERDASIGSASVGTSSRKSRSSTSSGASKRRTGMLVGRRAPTNSELHQLQNQQHAKPSLLLKVFVEAQQHRE